MLYRIKYITAALHQFLEVIGFSGKGKLEAGFFKKAVELIVIGPLRLVFDELLAERRQVGIKTNHLVINDSDKKGPQLAVH